MDILLLSNGKLPEKKGLLEYAFDNIQTQVRDTGAGKYLMIPYAVIRSSYEDRQKSVQAIMKKAGAAVDSIHLYKDPVQAIEDCEGIMVSGGNTWALNRALHDNDLIGPIRKAVLERGVPYIGWSAGTNVACPTIRNTNDMPIVSNVITPALNLVPFQINTHYLDANVEGHMGETREERIEEFCIMNPHTPVIGLREGSLFHITDAGISYFSAKNKPLRFFKRGIENYDIPMNEPLDWLLSLGC
jgi:dipeptidase E